MKLIRGIRNFDQDLRGCVLTIGNFDGMHRGHQELFRKLKREGKIRKLPVIVMIFEPQPLELFIGNKAPPRLTNLREKLQYLIQYKIEYVLCVRFDRHFSDLSAKKFIEDLLVKCLDVQFLVVGDDFRFGSCRQGNFFFLKNAGLQYGFEVVSTQSFCEDGDRISSTRIRKALEEDKLEKAENLLGHPFVISGRVIHGDKIGRTIGFPTANLLLHRMVSPVKGVYAVEVTGIGKNLFLGVANIGVRPTVSNVQKHTLQQLEVYLLDVVMNLYGYHIHIALRKKIRDEKQLSSLEELKKQIANDVLATKDFFGLLKS